MIFLPLATGLITPMVPSLSIRTVMHIVLPVAAYSSPEFPPRFEVRNNAELWLIHLCRVLLDVLDPDGTHHFLRLGTDLAARERPVVTVPVNYWQAAQIPEGTPFAFGTNVCAPAFTYEEFAIARREDSLRDFPDRADLITRLTRDN